MQIKIYSFLFFICCISTSSIAQQEVAIKISFQNYTNQNYGFQSAGKDGLLVYYDQSDDANGKTKLHLELYDTIMQNAYSKVVSRSARMNQKVSYYSSINKRQYFLFYDISESSGTTDFKIIVFDFLDKVDWSKSGSLPKDFLPSALFANKDALYIVPESSEMECLRIDMEDGTYKVAAIETGKEAFYSRTLENLNTKVTSVIFSEKSEVGQWGFRIRNFGDPEKLRRYTEISSKSIYTSLCTIKLLQIDSTVKYGIGTYAENQSAKDLDKANFMRQDATQDPYFVANKGFYFTKTENNKQSFIRYFPYPKINQYVDNTRKRQLGEKLSTYKVTMLDPVKLGSTIISVMEINKSSYQVVNRPSKDNSSGKFILEKEKSEYAVEQLNTKREYTLVLGYSDKGTILWRDSFITESQNVKVNSASRLSKGMDGEYYVLATFTDNGIGYSKISEGGIEKKWAPSKSFKLSEDSTSVKSQMLEFRHWYESKYVYIDVNILEDEGPVTLKLKSHTF